MSLAMSIAILLFVTVSHQRQVPTALSEARLRRAVIVAVRAIPFDSLCTAAMCRVVRIAPGLRRVRERSVFNPTAYPVIATIPRSAAPAVRITSLSVAEPDSLKRDGATVVYLAVVSPDSGITASNGRLWFSSMIVRPDGGAWLVTIQLRSEGDHWVVVRRGIGSS
jgi:hypothetical protein